MNSSHLLFLILPMAIAGCSGNKEKTAGQQSDDSFETQVADYIARITHDDCCSI